MMIKRNRIVYGCFIIFVILLGLLSRRFAAKLPLWLGSYSGDTLWALMVYLFIGFAFIKLTPKYAGIYALVFSYIIEISQLYHAPWIDAIRHTTIGGLVLGYGFLWSDLVCYTVGVLLGAFAEILFIKFNKDLSDQILKSSKRDSA